MVEPVEHVLALKSVDEVVVQERVVDGSENAKWILAIGLHQISAVAILVGEVVIAGKGLFTDGVEEVAPEREKGVVHMERGSSRR